MARARTCAGAHPHDPPRSASCSGRRAAPRTSRPGRAHRRPGAGADQAHLRERPFRLPQVWPLGAGGSIPYLDFKVEYPPLAPASLQGVARKHMRFAGTNPSGCSAAVAHVLSDPPGPVRRWAGGPSERALAVARGLGPTSLPILGLGLHHVAKPRGTRRGSPRSGSVRLGRRDGAGRTIGP